MVNMIANLDEDVEKGLVSILFTRSKCDRRTEASTDRTTEALLPVYPLQMVLHRDNKLNYKENPIFA